MSTRTVAKEIIAAKREDRPFKIISGSFYKQDSCLPPIKKIQAYIIRKGILKELSSSHLDEKRKFRLTIKSKYKNDELILKTTSAGNKEFYLHFNPNYEFLTLSIIELENRKNTSKRAYEAILEEASTDSPPQEQFFIRRSLSMDF